MPSFPLVKMVPVGDYEAEAAILEELSTYPQVKSTMGLASIEAIGGYCLGDALNPRQFSELIGLDYEVALSLYTLHAAQYSQYGEIITGMQDYSVPLFDMFMFLKTQLENANISLSGIAGEEMGAMLEDFRKGRCGSPPPSPCGTGRAVYRPRAPDPAPSPSPQAR